MKPNSAAAVASAVRRRRRPTADGPKDGFPIVGIGASAGGLEAFTALLKALPADTGFGFVLVQHLDPQHPSVLAELLARATSMPVRAAAHRLRVEPNRVYVIPPDTTLGIAAGVLQVRPRPRHRVAPGTVDFFLEALAGDRHEQAIGVILSGNANDGTCGLEAIKAAGGLTFAQDDSARFGSMPRSAVAAGCADQVLPPAAIARELARIARHPAVTGRAPAATSRRLSGAAEAASAAAAESVAGADTDGYRQIVQHLRAHSGVDFSLYKSSTILRRIRRRMVLNRQDTLERYAAFARGNTRELGALYADTLIGVTGFFRNPDAFAVLQRRVFPGLLAQPGDAPLRVWVLGCSTGQEAYSLAMAGAEVAEKVPRARRLQIFATDLNEASLAKARHGFYPKTLVQDVSPERLRRFFTEEEGGYRVVKTLRELVVFARQNVIGDPPFSRLDLISCRNVMIYFGPGLQQQVLPAFHYALNPGGFLLLGASESVGSSDGLFRTVDKKRKLFVRKAAPTPPIQLPLQRGAAAPLPQPAPRAEPRRGGGADALRSEPSAEREADRITVNRFAPPGVLIDAEFRILQFRGATGAFLEPPTGRASFDLLKMTREGLMLPLRAAILRAQAENATVRIEQVPVGPHGAERAVNAEVVPLKNLPERCFLVLFEESAERTRPGTGAGDADPGRTGRAEDVGRVVGLERDLAETRDYLQSVLEHQEAANEELQASNEEGQSANEELQSLNEELETSKEELESANEELTTVNEEMAGRNSELHRLNGDLINLQTSTKLAIVLLGRDRSIRRFSAEAGRQLGLHAGEAGCSLDSVRRHFPAAELDAMIDRAIAAGQVSESEVRDLAGRWFSLTMRPYLTPEQKIDGAVLVLGDIDALKRTEELMIEARDHAEAISRTVPNPMLVLTAGLRIQSANDAFHRTFGTSAAEIAGRSLFEIDRRSWNLPRLRHLLEEIVPQETFFDDFAVTHTFGRIGRRSLLLNARLVIARDGRPKEILLGIRDITERQQAEEALAAARRQLDGYAGKLGKQVARRTAELRAANRRLASAAASAGRSKEKFRALFLAARTTQEKLRRLSRQVLTAQEDERRRISRELHDGVVQLLVGINVELAALKRAADLGPRPLRTKIRHTQRLVEKAVGAVHRFARELRPAALDDLGLIAALQTFLRTMAAQNKLKINLTAFAGVEKLDIARRTVLYRVVQEALTNVARHARASAVDVTISRVAGAVRLEVSDNGKAFDVARTLSAKTNTRLGLLGLRERVESVGGAVTLESAPGRGTRVCAEIPFRRRGGAA